LINAVPRGLVIAGRLGLIRRRDACSLLFVPSDLQLVLPFGRVLGVYGAIALLHKRNGLGSRAEEKESCSIDICFCDLVTTLALQRSLLPCLRRRRPLPSGSSSTTRLTFPRRALGAAPVHCNDSMAYLLHTAVAPARQSITASPSICIL
jgi:hypothetical protein